MKTNKKIAVSRVSRSQAASLHLKLRELEETLHAIRSGEVEALGVMGARDERFFTVKGAEHAYRVMVETMNEGAVTLAGDGIILYANRSFAELVGTPLERVIGARIEDFAVAVDAQKLKALLSLGQNISRREEILLKGAGGLPVPALFSVHPLDDDGPAALCAVVTNLSEVISSRETHLRLAVIVESSDDAIMAITRDGIIMTWNPGAERLYGYAAVDAVGKPLSILIPSERAHELPKILAHVGRREIMNHFETVQMCKDDRRIEVSLTVSPIHGAAEGGIGASIIARDITERRRAEAQIRLTAKVFESSNQGIVITDAQANIISANQAFEEMTGYAGEEVVGKTPRILRSGRHDKAFYADVWRSIAEHGYWQGEIWHRRKNGEIYPEWLTVSAVKDDRGEITHYIGASSDIGEQKAAHERINYLAHYDELTGLPNRTRLQELLATMTANAKGNHTKVAVMFMDLDRFKDINDSLGHAAGDALLAVFAERLRGCIRAEDTAIRLGGDEFVAVLADIQRSEHVALVAEKIIEAAAKPYVIAGRDIVSTLSIGISLYPDNGGDAGTLVRNADMAMYAAKETGRNNYQFFSAKMDQKASMTFSLENDLRKALEHGEFVLHYQPQVDLSSGRIVGVEALIRWQHPKQGLISPAHFIPFAEERGFIVPIGEWVMQEAFRQNREWQLAGLPAVPVAVNVSPLQFQQKDFVKKTVSLAEEAGLPPQYVELEITESAIMRDVQAAQTVLGALKAAGFQLSIDDFGTGYSSLNYLKRFPIDKLKIDQSFMQGLPTDVDDAAIVSAILAMAQALRLITVAEGVETAEQVEFLRVKGCDQAQGYYYNKPLPVERLTGLLSV
jgi:diguanylate cyclase (GGDEF)-like protein/PAS domain S-box-containing protein